MKNIYLKTIGLFLVGATLSACSNFPIAFEHGGNPITQPFNYEKAQALKVDETSFKGALVKEYQALSTKEGVVWADWFDSDFFARKALNVAKSENGLPPENPALWRFSKEGLVQFQQSYEHLNTALVKGRENFPIEAAKAQASFDCWVEEQEEGWQNNEIAKCKGEFDAAMAKLNSVLMAKPVEPAPDFATLYNVFFDFDSAVVTPIGQQVLQALVEDWGPKAVQFALIGHTDRAGSDTYNKKLSLKRAQSVKTFISKLGLTSDKMTTKAMGEGDLAVATEDGVREAKNRRVVIQVTK
jgi:OmpA-OmpF porin, OOP family